MITQNEIRQALGVADAFDASAEIERRCNFLADYIRNSGLKSYVLGISGGIDSTTAGFLAQRAVERLRMDGYYAYFIAVRLPYGTQADEADAQQAIDNISPDEVVTVNIKESTDAIMDGISRIGFTSADHLDFVKGNVKARQRMVAQYAIAGAREGLVIGTDHAAEALMGFFTKFGDGACDIAPLSGLTKRRVRAIADFIGIDSNLVSKTPTADLEDLQPGKPDEVAYGLTYDQLDDFLEGKDVGEETSSKIIDFYMKTAHKRALPVTP